MYTSPKIMFHTHSMWFPYPGYPLSIRVVSRSLRVENLYEAKNSLALADSLYLVMG